MLQQQKQKVLTWANAHRSMRPHHSEVGHTAWSRPMAFMRFPLSEIKNDGKLAQPENLVLTVNHVVPTYIYHYTY